MDVAYAILFAKAIDISRVTADYSSTKFEFCKLSVPSPFLHPPSCEISAIAKMYD